MELPTTLIDVINESLGDNRNNLIESSNYLINKLKSERDKKRENFISNLPINYNDEEKFDNLSKDINKLHDKIFNLKLQNTQLNQTIENYKNEQKSDKQKNLEIELKPLILKSIHIERYLNYVNTLIHVNDLNSKIDVLIKKSKNQHDKLIKNVVIDDQNKETINKLNDDYNLNISNIIDLYSNLILKYNHVKEANCLNLNNYLKESINYYYENINLILTNEFDEILKLISYPFVLTHNQTDKTNHTDQLVDLNKKKFNLCASRIIEVELKNNEISKNKINSNENMPFIIQLLTRPLYKRFKYHFGGNRTTNNIEKPEWYLTQIIQWIKDHQNFLNDKIQPQFDKYYGQKINAIDEFIKSLVFLVKDKFEDDFNKYLKNDEINFSHTIDELLLFNKQLTTYFQYPSDLYNCFNILCDNEITFSNWLQLEYKICTRKVDLMFLNQNKYEIWSCNFADIDENKPPHCTESFMLLIKTISDRYEKIQNASKKLRFLKLQIILMDEYRLRLCQINRDLISNPLDKVNLGVLNAINYMIYVLNEWKNSKFFIQMQFLDMRFKQFEEKYQHQRKLDENNDKLNVEEDNVGIDNIENETDDDDDDDESNNEHDNLNSIVYQFELRISKELCDLFDSQMNISSKSTNELDELIDIKSTVFDGLLESFEKVHEDIIKSVVTNCIWEIKTRGKQYKKEKWSLMQIKEFKFPVLTQSAADMLVSLKNLLNLLNETLATKLFILILKRLTIEIDKYFYEEIIKETQFNDDGSLQISYDINKYLIPILSQFTDDIKIETYLRRTKEALTLLQLIKGSALLLKEVLYKKEDNHNDMNLVNYNAIKALKDIGVSLLTIEDAKFILNIRIDL